MCSMYRAGATDFLVVRLIFKRASAGIDTKMAILSLHDAHIHMTNELYSFHATLKTNYLNGKVNWRMDLLIDALLRIKQDCFSKIALK